MKPIAVVTTLGQPRRRRAARPRPGRAQARRLRADLGDLQRLRWKGAVEQEPEFRLLLKTTDSARTGVESTIRDLHSYDLPAIHAFAFEHVFPAYATWIAENVQRVNVDAVLADLDGN